MQIEEQGWADTAPSKSQGQGTKPSYQTQEGLLVGAVQETPESHRPLLLPLVALQRWKVNRYG